MSNYTKLTEFNGMPVVEFSAGGYTAILAHEIGSNVIRLHDDKNGIEFFRFKADNPAENIKKFGDCPLFICQTDLQTEFLKLQTLFISFP